MTFRYRNQSASGDYLFGHANEFLVDSAQAVALAISTRLQLATGEWFIDTTEGTDYAGQIFGYGTYNTRDVEVRRRILDTPGVLDIIYYNSSQDAKRNFTVNVTVNTIFGVTTVTQSL